MDVKTNGNISFWYADIGGIPAKRPALPGDREADVCIIGAGDIGGAVAHALARSERVSRVLLIDADAKVAAGKALDIQQSGAVDLFHVRLDGTDDVSRVAGISRRDAIRTMAATAGVSLVDPGPVLTRLIAEQSAQGCGAEHALGRLVGTLPLSRPDGVVQPYGVKIGRPGLDARLNTDLSKLEADRLITPTDQIYVRTDCPPAVAAHQGRWTIKTTGLLARPSTVPLVFAPMAGIALLAPPLLIVSWGQTPLRRLLR